RVRRWPTAQAMADAIEGILSARGTDGVEPLRAFVERIDGAGRESAPITPVSTAPRSRRVVTVAASILALSLVATAVGWSLSSGAAPAASLAATPAETVEVDV